MAGLYPRKGAIEAGADAVKVGIGFLRGFGEGFDEFVTDFGAQFLEQVAGEIAALVEGQTDTQTEFGVVFEEAVGPSWTVAVFVGCPRRG